MQIYSNLSNLQLTRPMALTIGNFDGIHRGHQALLRELQQIAARFDLSSAILTFDPHPLAVLRPNHPHSLLTTPRERLHLSAMLGIDLGVIQPFTLEVAALEPAEFMGDLVKRLNVRALVVGPDFALGRNRSGNLDVLAELGKDLGYTIHIIEPVAWDDQPVRSSAIRNLLSEGDVVAAAALLGRPYHVTGLVIQGDQRGRQIGIPTANLKIPANKLWPADGVYATRTYIHERAPTNSNHNDYAVGNPSGNPGSAHLFNSVTNLGMRPTVGGTEHRFETHLLDFPKADGPEADGNDNLYGQHVTVEFMARLRGEQRFNSLAELVAQIHADIEQARALPPTPVPLATPFFLQTS